MKKALLDDESLVQLFKETREEHYFIEIFSRFKQRIYVLSLRLMRNDRLAEELTQDIFTKVFDQINTYPGRDFYPWLVRITQKEYIGRIRGSKREAVAPPIPSTEGDGPILLNGRAYTADEMNLLCQDVLKPVEELGPEQKACFLLKYTDGYNDEEIALLTGYTIKQVKTYLQNGRRKFILHWLKSKKKSIL